MKHKKGNNPNITLKLFQGYPQVNPNLSYNPEVIRNLIYNAYTLNFMPKLPKLSQTFLSFPKVSNIHNSKLPQGYPYPQPGLHQGFLIFPELPQVFSSSVKVSPIHNPKFA